MGGRAANDARCPRSSVSGSAIRRNISSAFTATVRAHHRHRARRRTRGDLQCAIAGRLQGARVRRQSRRRNARARRRSGLCAGFGSAQRQWRSGVGRIRRRFRRADICDRSSICRRSAFTATMAAPGSTSTHRRAVDTQPRRLAAEHAWQEFGARLGVAVAILRLAGIYGPGQNALVQVARGKAPPHRQSRASLQPHPCRRHRPSDRCRLRAHCFRDFQCRRRRAVTAWRSGRLRGAAHGPRPAAGNHLRRRRAVDVADGFEFLAGMPAREERQAQARARRRVALSDLSRGIAGVVCGEAIIPHPRANPRELCGTRRLSANSVP